MSAPAEQLPRSAWTDTEPGFPNWPERKINPNDVWGNVLHYPAAGNRSFAGLSKKEIARWLNIWRDYHVNTRGWADIGYPVAVDQEGREWWAAGDEYAAAHSATKTFGNANQQLMAILLILGDNEKPSDAMVAAVNRRLAAWRKKFPNMRFILGHQEVPGASTRCPGPEAMRLLNSGSFGLERPGPYAVSPVVGRVTSEWGWRTHPKTGTRNHHNGIDLAPPKPGQTGVDFCAMFGGTVRAVGNGYRKKNPITGYRNTGSYIIIDGPGGGSEFYGHHAGKAYVKPGDVVQAGQPLAEMGAVGDVTGIHLHLELWSGRTPGTAYDPRIAFKQLGLTPGKAGETVQRSVVGMPIKTPVRVAAPKNTKWDAEGRDRNGKFRSGRPPGMPKGFILIADGVAGEYQWTTLQKHLRDAGYKHHSVDGDFGPHSILSFQEFLWDQGFRHHARDQVWGPATSQSAQEWLISVGEKFHAVDRDWGRYSNLSLQHALLDDDVRN